MTTVQVDWGQLFEFLVTIAIPGVTAAFFMLRRDRRDERATRLSANGVANTAMSAAVEALTKLNDTHQKEIASLNSQLDASEQECKALRQIVAKQGEQIEQLKKQNRLIETIPLDDSGQPIDREEK